MLVFVDPKRRVKISYGIGIFSRRSIVKPHKVTQYISYDTPSKSWIIKCILVPGNSWIEIGPSSEQFQWIPWVGWRHFSCTITRTNFMNALKAMLEQQPQTKCSIDPADYQLSTFHLNAEITYETAPAQLGWSMRHALLTLETPNLPSFEKNK
jgi:hypothetical protein